jgi:hypothetical protein
MVERLVRNEEVWGSIPHGSTKQSFASWSVGIDARNTPRLSRQLLSVAAVALGLLAGAGSSARAAGPVVPKIVIQTGHPGGYADVAAWTPDSRFVVTAQAQAGEILIWDGANGTVVDRLHFEALTESPQKVAAMRATADGAMVLTQASQRGDRAVIDTYRFDLATKTLVKTDERVGEIAMAPEQFDVVSPDGRRSLISDGSGGRPNLDEERLMLRTGTRRRFVGLAGEAVEDWALSGDARLAVLANQTDTSVIDLDAGRATPLHTENLGDMTFVGQRLLVSNSVDQRPISQLIDPGDGRIVAAAPTHCLLTPLGATRSFVASSGVCAQTTAAADDRLLISGGRPPSPGATTAAWTTVPIAGFTGRAILEIAASPDGRRVAVHGVAVEDPDQDDIAIVDLTDKTVRLISLRPWEQFDAEDLEVRRQPEPHEKRLAFSQDGETLFYYADKRMEPTHGKLLVWSLTTPAAPREIAWDSVAPNLIIGDGDAVWIGNVFRLARFRLADGAALASFPVDGALANGVLDGNRVFWTQANETIVFRDMRRGAEVIRLSILPGRAMIAVTPSGRYDTDLGADAPQFRWLMSDEPLRSLAPQTFMRTYYQPGLLKRVLSCARIADPLACEASLPPIPELASLNRTLPEARVIALKPTGDGAASVTVEAREGVNATAANGKTHSGLHDLRLFRDGHLVAQYPEPRVDGAAPGSAGRPTTWAEDTDVPRDSGGGFTHTFTVDVPELSPKKPAVFTAYAFNEDRVKGETSPPMKLPPQAVRHSRARRAYVIAVGVDETAQPEWRLNFAAKDADAMASALGSIPGRNVSALAVTSTKAGRLASRDNLRDIFAVLATGDSAARVRLIQAGIAAGGLDRATPDDLVILTFSGHGWADEKGAFYIVPADGRRIGSDGPPDTKTLVSAAELTSWLRLVDAGEMAIVIDACQSAASVDAGGFKPGPMGDPGLGQLAFDKGIRILAAAQANEEAQEDLRLRQGLLTYALVQDGLQAKRSAALRLDAWLREGAERLPSLRPPARRPADHVLAPTDDDQPAAVQQPALFDFTGKASDVVLRAATNVP